jgi:hypothetical protein
LIRRTLASDFFLSVVAIQSDFFSRLLELQSRRVLWVDWKPIPELRLFGLTFAVPLGCRASQEHVIGCIQAVSGPDHRVAETIGSYREFDRHERLVLPMKKPHLITVVMSGGS